MNSRAPKPVSIPDAIRKRIEDGEQLSLELGCGNRKRHSNAIGVDALYYEGVDIVGDIYTVLQQFPDQCISAVYSYHCFEHLPNVGEILNELGRVMKSQSRLHVVVPHFSNPYFYSDVTHLQTFGLYTFSYFTKENLFTRRCPTYERKIYFETKRIRLVFKSPRPFYGRWGFKKIVQTLVNLNRYFLELYEENFCWMFPCYEIEYDLERL